MSDEETLNSLSNLVVNCPELAEIESLLGKFNLFRVLNFEEGEIRHSNVLSWLLDPKESHGMGDLFLRRFLMLVLNDSESGQRDLNPVEIDSAEIRNVEVLREWSHIDITIKIQLAEKKEKDWVVVIENKVNSQQHSDQLTKYREVVESGFPDDKKLFVFLCKNKEEPEDEAYVEATYDQVYEALSRTFNEKRNTIGEGPCTLVRNYLNLLEEKFMSNSRIAELASKIYKSHKLALDTIFEHRPDEKGYMESVLNEKLSNYQGEYKIIQMPSSNSYFRFLIDKWNTPKNRAGTGWGEDGAYVLLEVPLRTKKAQFKIVCGKAPVEWMENAWTRSRKAPFVFIRKTTVMANQWITLYSKTSHIDIDDFDSNSAEEIAHEVWKWIEDQLAEQSFRDSADIIAEMLEDLPEVS